MSIELEDPLIDPRKPKELARECPLDIYLSGSDGGGYGSTYFPWGYRMHRAKERGLTPTYVEDCDTFILDSAINVEDITTDDVIDDVEKYNPDYVIAADVLYDPGKTTERVHEMAGRLEAADADTEMIVPLQPTASGRADHHLHYPDVAGLSDYYAIGGLRDTNDVDIIREAAENVRAAVGDDVRLHGLAFGMKYLTDPRVRTDPMVDSVDCSSPIREGRSGRMHLYEDGEYKTIQMGRPTGRMSLLSVSMASGTTLISMAQMMVEEYDKDD